MTKATTFNYLRTSSFTHASVYRAWIRACALLLGVGWAGAGCGSDSDNAPTAGGQIAPIPSGGSAADSGATTTAGGTDSAGTSNATSGSAGEGSIAHDGAGESGEGGAGGEGGTNAAPGPEMIIERVLTIRLALTTTAATDTVPASAFLVITARDGSTPVVTDLWLYTLSAGEKTPLTGFTSTAARKSGTLLLPALINGQPSGLEPADDGVANGLMTNISRGTLSQGAFVPTVNGTVTVTLPAVPTLPILVVAGVEDQRYAGAGVINPDGTPGPGVTDEGLPEAHVKRSYERDVAPILRLNCAIACHHANGPQGAWMYEMGTRDELVNDNFALTEQTTACKTQFPNGGNALDACVQAVNKAQFLVEPGAPAVSDLLERSRPDEDAGSSTTGLGWWGGVNPKVRYNAKYGDRRMPSTTLSLDPADWKNAPTAFDTSPEQFQILYWVAQGALP